MRWLSFVQQTVTVTAAAAAGAAATVATANPVAGAAAGAAAKKSAEDLLTELMPAQQDALDTLLDRTQNMERLLGGIRFDLHTLMDGSWQAALLHLEDAVNHPDRAAQDLRLARNTLYQAWGQSTASRKRTLIAQQLGVVYALLGEQADSRAWLTRSVQQATQAAEEELAAVIVSLPTLPKSKATVKGSGPAAVRLPEGTMAVYRQLPQTAERKLAGVPMLAFLVKTEPLARALATVAQTRLDFARLQTACGLPDANARATPRSWTVEGEHVEGRPVIRVSLTRDDTLWTVCGANQNELPAAGLLASLAKWTFVVQEVPLDLPGQVFVTGARPQLGAGYEETAVPLIQTFAASTWYTKMTVVDKHPFDPVPYRYFRLTGPRGAPEWDSRERVLAPAFRLIGAPVRTTIDTWN
jgi:hypothetical protein